ncbi:MAG: RsmB/NOP family class I SAM-dependent RNA methyltransferase, partial [Alphaproteobacteria bacterium]|nr:RsmB/NOP family class I SAM-dependent RNA methyltransferase [Alphaproteobacteria bacterium]
PWKKRFSLCPIMPQDDAASLNLTSFWYEKLKQQFGEDVGAHIRALDQEAPLDLRVNTLKMSRDEARDFLLTEHKITAEPTPYSPVGIRVTDKLSFPNVLIQEGLFEPQDEGSQLITLLCDVKPGIKVVDFCAGAGGKTLGLAMQMENRGQITASDISESRLKRARERLKRLDLHNVVVRVIDGKWIKNHEGQFDRVLVDAPCSGSGTWRRNPDLKRRTGQNDLDELVQKQRDILAQASRLVKKGGRLIYATCSLLHDENDGQINWFLETFSDFKKVDLSHVGVSVLTANPCTTSTFSLTPLHHTTDGFFVGCVERVVL